MLTQSLTGLGPKSPVFNQTVTPNLFSDSPKSASEKLELERSNATGSLAQAQPSHFQALIKPQVRFGHALFRHDYMVSHRPDTALDAVAASKTLRSFLLRDLIKREQLDPSTLKYSLNAYGGSAIAQTALADNAVLVDRPVDTIIQSHAGTGSIMPLMMIRAVGNGRRFISADATLQLGPAKMGMVGKNHDLQVQRDLVNKLLRDKESLVMLATGETNRKKVYDDLNSGKDFNSLEALAYGQNGLVDGILVGSDLILTRKKLDAFYRDQEWSPKQIEQFNKNPNSLGTRALKPYLEEIPETSQVPAEAQQHEDRAGHYISSENQLKPQLDNNSDLRQAAQEQLHVFARPMQKARFEVMERLPFLKTEISNAFDLPMQLQIRGAAPSKGLVYDDVILFQDAFNFDTAAQIHQALLALNEKKTAQRKAGQDPSNIKILMNSPGGYLISGNELISAISQQKSKVDVIVQGMAASCGAYLLAGATGNKFATPNARVMIHQAHAGYFDNNLQANQTADSIQEGVEKYAAVIAKGSGRSQRAVERDLRQDTWLNSVESMFYGKKGLLDGILVGADKVITRADIQHYLETDSTVQEYLTEKFGTDDAKTNVDKYLKDRLRNLTTPSRVTDPEKFEDERGRDPFDNPLRTIVLTASTSAKALEDVPALKGSVTRQQPTIDQFIIGEQPAMLMGEDQMSAGRQTPTHPFHSRRTEDVETLRPGSSRHDGWTSAF